MSFGTEWDIRPESTSGYCGSLNSDSDYTEETFIAFKKAFAYITRENFTEEERAKILKDGPAKAIRDDMFSQSAKVLERMSGKEEIKTKKKKSGDKAISLTLIMYTQKGACFQYKKQAPVICGI